ASVKVGRMVNSRLEACKNAVRLAMGDFVGKWKTVGPLAP
ncbi:unnamed protein product, partial [marine sediment metagenome]